MTWSTSAPRRGPATCTEDGCENRHLSRGLCEKHYRRARKAGTLPPRIRPLQAECSDPECSAQAYSRNLCRPHYSAWIRDGGLGVCVVDGCTRGKQAQERCQPHAQRRRRYGLTDEEMAAIDRQELCALCRKRPPEHVDHDHVTGRTREALCRLCNTGLGGFEDDPDLLRRAADYIEEHRGRYVVVLP